jgi:hypothetical protein
MSNVSALNKEAIELRKQVIALQMKLDEEAEFDAPAFYIGDDFFEDQKFYIPMDFFDADEEEQSPVLPSIEESLDAMEARIEVELRREMEEEEVRRRVKERLIKEKMKAEGVHVTCP